MPHRPRTRKQRGVADERDEGVATERFERLVTAAELARALHVSTDWVYEKWQAGELPGFRLTAGTGRGVRFRLSEIERWLEGTRVGPGPFPPNRVR